MSHNLNLTFRTPFRIARKILRLIEALEDSDDVQDVFANFDASDEVMAQLEDED